MFAETSVSPTCQRCRAQAVRWLVADRSRGWSRRAGPIAWLIVAHELRRLVRHTLSLGMEAEVFSNLVHVTPDLWELFATPGVRLATSWYSNERLEHRQITGRDTHRRPSPTSRKLYDGISRYAPA